MYSAHITIPIPIIYQAMKTNIVHLIQRAVLVLTNHKVLNLISLISIHIKYYGCAALQQPTISPCFS